MTEYSSPESSSDDEEFYTAVTVAWVQQLEATYACKKGMEASTNPLVFVIIATLHKNDHFTSFQQSKMRTSRSG